MGDHFYALTANRRSVFSLTNGEEVAVGLMSYVCKCPDNDETRQYHADDRRMARLYTARMNASEDRYRGKVPPFLTVAPPKGAPQGAMALYRSEGKAVHLDCYWDYVNSAKQVEGRDGKLVWVEFPAPTCHLCGDHGVMVGAGGYGALAYSSGMACPLCGGFAARQAAEDYARKLAAEAAEEAQRTASARAYAEAQKRLAEAETAAQKAAAAVVAANAALAHANAALATTANAANAARTAAHGK